MSTRSTSSSSPGAIDRGLGHWFEPPSLAAPLHCCVSAASLTEAGEARELVAVYHVDVTLGSARWTVCHRFSEFVAFYAKLGRDAPACRVIAHAAFACGALRGSLHRIRPKLIEERVVGLNAWLGEICSTLQFSSVVSEFLDVSSADMSAYKMPCRAGELITGQGCAGDEGRHSVVELQCSQCDMCTAGVMCTVCDVCTDPADEQQQQPSTPAEPPAAADATAAGSSWSAWLQPRSYFTDGEGGAYRAHSYSPDSVVTDPSNPRAPSPSKQEKTPQQVLISRSQTPQQQQQSQRQQRSQQQQQSQQQQSQQQQSQQHCCSYDRTAAALATDLCLLARQRGSATGGTPSLAEVRRFVDHCCLVDGVARGQPGRVLKRFPPTVMVCALTYVQRLRRTERGDPDAYVLAALLAEDGWQVALLVMLALVTKTYSDFADATVSNAVLCERRSGLRAGWPGCAAPRLARTELMLIRLLDFRTTVRTAEFFHASM